MLLSPVVVFTSYELLRAPVASSGMQRKVTARQNTCQSAAAPIAVDHGNYSGKCVSWGIPERMGWVQSCTEVSAMIDNGVQCVTRLELGHRRLHHIGPCEFPRRRTQGPEDEETARRWKPTCRFMMVVVDEVCAVGLRPML